MFAMALIRYFVPFVTAFFFYHFLGKEGTAIMTTGGNLVLFGILLFSLTFIVRRNRFRLNQKSGFRLLYIIYISILFSISLFGCCLRTYFLSNLCVYFLDLFSFFAVFSVVSGGGQPLPLPGPSTPSNSSSEDSFELQVLSEPWPVTHNVALEASMRNRLLALEQEKSPFLLSEERGSNWAEVKTQLDNCPSQREYNRLLEFENRDLQIREKRHSCYSIYQEILTAHPAVAENADSNPQEAFCDFLNEKRSELDLQGGAVFVRDQRELRFLGLLSHDLTRDGPNSLYINIIFGG
uniref:Uncharacterized protein n=2 Tax=Nicotiana TaxID=4085 RepID=A0A142I104_TOBAC|nr:hypothetical protein [Nicotiana undulata]AMR36235.1 hypothetical protein [Nicotiana tabacum]AMR36237.1 hypothetical protein [Nicotiana tabacum]